MSWSAWVFGLDRHHHDRFRERHPLQNQGVLDVTQSIARGRLAETDGRHDITGRGYLDIFALVRVHPQQSRYPFLVTGGSVQEVGAGVYFAGVHPQIGQATDIRVGHNFESQGRNRFIFGRLADNLLFEFIYIVTDDRGHIERRRKEIDDGVKQLLDTFVLERRTGQDGNHVAPIVAFRTAAITFIRSSGSSCRNCSKKWSSTSATASSNFSRYALAVSIMSSGTEIIVGGTLRLLVEHPEFHGHQVDDSG